MNIFYSEGKRNGLLFKVIIFFFLTQNLSADSLKVNLGLWSGKYKSELEDHFNKDDLLDGAPDGTNRINQEWRNGKSFLFPLGAVYTKKTTNWTFLFRGNYFHRSIQYDYTGIMPSGNFSNVKLNGGYSSDYEFDFGIRKGFLKEKLFISPRIGIRSHVKGFTINDQSYSSNTLLGTTSGGFESHSNHLYLGAEFQYYLRKKISVVMDIVLPMPKPLELMSYLGDLGSKMNFDFDRAGLYSNRVYIELNDIKSRYTYEMTRVAIGVQYDWTEKFSIQLGYRQENTKVTYDSYSNTPLRIANGGTFENFTAEPSLQYLILEDYLDRSIYQEAKSNTQRGIYLTGSYKWDFSEKPTQSK